MDLSISPDLEAYQCYLIVALVGVFVALTRVTESLSGFHNVWTQWRTWVLCIIYVIIPVALYWFLDRTGAIKDTSLFAALLVGFGYERILAGNSATLQAPENISQIWSPLLAFANRTAEKIGSKAYLEDLRLRRMMIARIAGYDKNFGPFMTLAEAKTFDTEIFKASLEAIDADSSLSAEMKRERKTELAYDEVTADEDYWFEFFQKGIIKRKEYLWRHHEGAGKATASIVAILFLGMIYGSYQKFDLDVVNQSYALWRLQKQETSMLDQDRTERRITQILVNESSNGELAKRLKMVLKMSTTDVDTVDIVIKILLSNRCAALASGFKIDQMLTAALNSPDNDSRARIHRALVYLAGQVPDGVKEWEPGAGDSVVDLQVNVDVWQNFWMSKPLAAKSIGCAP